MTATEIIKPTVGRKVWFRPNGTTQLQRAGAQGYGTDLLNLIDKSQPLDATVVYVWDDRMVNLLVLDHYGHPFVATSAAMLQPGDAAPTSGYYAEWMPYQKGQAAKAEAAEKGSEPAGNEYRQPSQREQLEYALTSGAASYLAANAREATVIANGIKEALNVLHPAAADPKVNQAETHAGGVLYPAIERAMGELSKLHDGFSMEVNRAFNILHDAFWSEAPAPASATPKRRETAAEEPAVCKTLNDPLGQRSNRPRETQALPLRSGTLHPAMAGVDK